jgi:hypothetical protein
MVSRLVKLRIELKRALELRDRLSIPLQVKELEPRTEIGHGVFGDGTRS